MNKGNIIDTLRLYWHDWKENNVRMWEKAVGLDKFPSDRYNNARVFMQAIFDLNTTEKKKVSPIDSKDIVQLNKILSGTENEMSFKNYISESPVAQKLEQIQGVDIMMAVRKKEQKAPRFKVLLTFKATKNEKKEIEIKKTGPLQPPCDLTNDSIIKIKEWIKSISYYDSDKIERFVKGEEVDFEKGVPVSIEIKPRTFKKNKDFLYFTQENGEEVTIFTNPKLSFNNRAKKIQVKYFPEGITSYSARITGGGGFQGIWEEEYHPYTNNQIDQYKSNYSTHCSNFLGKNFNVITQYFSQFLESYFNAQTSNKKAGIKNSIQLQEDYLKQRKNKNKTTFNNKVRKELTEKLVAIYLEYLQDTDINFFAQWLQEPNTRKILQEFFQKIPIYKTKSNFKIFYDELKKFAEKTRKYGEWDDKQYPASFGGDFMEVDTIVRPQLVLSKTFKTSKSFNYSSTKMPTGEVLGKEQSDANKQVPADGKITFYYPLNSNSPKKYTCTFQSKASGISTITQGFYAKKQWSFWFGKECENKNSTNLYSYPQEMINDINNLVKLTLQNSIEKLSEEKIFELVDRDKKQQITKICGSSAEDYFIGAVPGLMRIQSYVKSGTLLEQEVNNCDFFVISGYYIPSVYILNCLNKQKEELRKKKADSILNIYLIDNKYIQGYNKSKNYFNLLEDLKP